MDKKFILYAALALVAVSLWSSWKKDNAPTTPQTAQTTTTAKTITDVPVIKPQQVVNVSKIPASRLVHIQNDVLDVSIDTLGGNVVSAKLLKYAAKLHKPEPIQILTSDNEKLYVAQSGILGIQDKPLQYKVSQQNKTLKLTWRNAAGIAVIKSFTLTPDSYVINMNYKVVNKDNKNWSGQIYTQIKRYKPKETGGLFHPHTFTGAAIFNPHKTSGYNKISYKKMDKENLSLDIDGGWVAMQQRYFLSAWVPNQTKPHHYYSHVTDDQFYTIGMTNSVSVAKAKQQTFGAKLYVGPEIGSNLRPLAKGLNLTVDYGWLWPISIAIFWLMQQIYKIVGNWGWAIVIVTLLIKLVFYKFSATGYKASAKMRNLAPKMKALKERYGDDRQQMSKATMELYKKEKINPISGCLPMLIQVPFFIALYYVLIEAVQLRHAPFIFWIHDLSVKDPYFILPILMGISMFFTTKLSPTSMDPSQAKIMLFMPIVFTVLFASFPAGLVLYWLVNNLVSLLQQWYVMRKCSYESARK